MRRDGYVIRYHPWTGPRFLGAALREIAWASQQERDGIVGFALLSVALNFVGQAILAERLHPIATPLLN